MVLVKFDWKATLELPDDVRIVESNSLPRNVRSQLKGEDEAYVVERPGNREWSKAIDIHGVRLLEAFRKPTKIVDAVIALSRSLSTPAEPLLEEAFPFLQSMLQAKILAVCGSDLAKPTESDLKSGDKLGCWTIDECVRLVSDSEVYRSYDDKGRVAAIKRVRQSGIEQGLKPLLEREAKILERIEGGIVPELYDSRLEETFPWIAVAWIAGRKPGQIADYENRKAACLLIADAYARLHSQNILHGDVHSGNIIVDDEGKVTLLDFGLARVPGDADFDKIFRGAVGVYWEPEYAESMLKGNGDVSVSPAGEQYAVATLIDFLLVGEESFKLPFDAAKQWHAIAEADRRCFVERGLPAWPIVEAVLRRACARDPKNRYAQMADFASSLRRALGRPAAAVAPSPNPLQAFLSEVAPGGELFESGLETSPRCSFNFGATGIAFTLYRIARARDDGDLFSLAEFWHRRAENDMDLQGSFHDENEFRKEDLGTISPYHTVSGFFFTQVLMARSASAMVQVDRTIKAFVESLSDSQDEELDLTLGKSGALLASALLYGTRPAPRLRKLGDRLLDDIWSTLSKEPSIRSSSKIGYLGIAHGWAGFVYASLAWSRATAVAVDPRALNRFDELLELLDDGLESGNGMPIVVPGHPMGRGMARTMAGWCHGQAGHSFLLLLAANVLGDRSLVDSAARLGERAYESDERMANLCCGLAGRSYNMLALAKATDEKIWERRAKELLTKAVEGTACDAWPNSLYKGRVGLALLAVEIERPDLAAMPLFEDEGWLS